MLYDSLHDKLLTLPDASLVYPAHGAGSLCGKALSKETVSTIGEQRRVNYALQPMSKDRFVDIVTADQPDAPAYFTYDAVLNTKERTTLTEALERRADHTRPAACRCRAVGAQILDTRDPATSRRHTWLAASTSASGGSSRHGPGSVLSRERPIVIVADPDRERESTLRLGRIGFDHVAGYLSDGMLSIERQPSLTASTERLSAPACGGTTGID